MLKYEYKICHEEVSCGWIRWIKALLSPPFVPLFMHHLTRYYSCFCYQAVTLTEEMNGQDEKCLRASYNKALSILLLFAGKRAAHICNIKSICELLDKLDKLLSQTQ